MSHNYKTKLCPHAAVCTVSFCYHKEMHQCSCGTFKCGEGPGTYEFNEERKINGKIKTFKVRAPIIVRCKKYKKLFAKIISL